MVFKNKNFNKFWRFSCSFQLGIPILVTIGVLIAWGTIVEAQYNDANAAKRLVFDSWMMWIAMSALIYNLTVVVIDRWPWKPIHYPFITVHAGIIILVFGGYITSEFGLDGSVAVGIGSKNNFVSIPKTDLVAYATYNGDNYVKVLDREVDFFTRPPSEQSPVKILLQNDSIEIIKFLPYAILQNKVKATPDLNAGSSVRFQLMNANVKQVQQITQERKGKEVNYNLGPAAVYLGTIPATSSGQNKIVLEPQDNDVLNYAVFHRQQEKAYAKGVIKIGDVVQTGWMGLEFRLLDYMQHATEEYEVKEVGSSTPLTVAAIQFKHKELTRWLALNDIVKLFSDNVAYLFSFQNRRIDLGFQIQLEKFDVIKYQGTQKAREYASRVSIFDGPAPTAPATTDSQPKATVQDANISMNQPLKHAGFTIYQASFQEDEVTREPVASVFSINKDPGRWIKYLGSLVFSLGIVWLFYQRRKRATAA